MEEIVDLVDENSVTEAKEDTKPKKEESVEEQMQLEIFTPSAPVIEIKAEEKFITLEEGIEQGKKLLLDSEMRIADLYGEYFANRGFNYTAKEVIVNFEEYLQALFLVACMNNRDLQEEEMRFIWAVLSHADVFAGTDSIEGALEKSKTIIKTNPHAILITVAVDKYYEKNETAFILNGIYGVYKIMCDLAKIVAVKKEKLLATIIEFARTQGVKL